MAAVLLALLCAALYASGRRVRVRRRRSSPRSSTNAGVRWHELSLAHVRDAFARPHPIVAALLRAELPPRAPRRPRLPRGERRDPRRERAARVRARPRAVPAARAAARVGLSDEAAPWAALAGAALFAAHPLQVEAVTWIAQRGSLLAALGSLAATLCYLRARGAGRRARALWWTATGACWLFALGSREAAVALPVAIALCEWLFGGDPRGAHRAARRRPRSVSARGRRAVADGAQRLRARALREPRRVAVARSPESRARSRRLAARARRRGRAAARAARPPRSRRAPLPRRRPSRCSGSSGPRGSRPRSDAAARRPSTATTSR